MSKQIATMETLLKGNRERIAAVLPKGIQVDRTIALATGLWNQTPALQKCTASSFATSVFQAVSMGLELSPLIGHVYLIPYNNKKKGITECQLQVGYKGLIELAKRSKDNPKIWARTVYANDVFEYQLGSKEYLKHIPYLGSDRGEFMCAYACLETSDGVVSFEIVAGWEVLEIRDRFSKSGDKYGPWTTSFDEMAKKTATKRLLKYASLSAELQQAIHQDDLSSLGVPQETTIDLKDVTPEQKPREIVKTSIVSEPEPQPEETFEEPAPEPEKEIEPVKEQSEPEKPVNMAPNKREPVILRFGKLLNEDAWNVPAKELADYLAEVKAQSSGKTPPKWFTDAEQVLLARSKEIFK